MPTIDVQGVSIDFPYEPYECQVKYMNKLIDALKQSKHAVLESPTGTGKTLCLLCASLAWIDGVRATISEDTDNMIVNVMKSNMHDFQSKSVCGSIPKVIFASRTHSQLSQAVNALKSTIYAGRRIGVVGSRDQLCLLPDVISMDSNSAKIYACRMRVQTRTCEYYRNWDAKRDELISSLMSEGIADIEDLAEFGRKTRCCPYYMSRELKTDANLIFMPYNYLLDSKIRTLYNINLENTAIIFDEAHNIEQVCEDASSVCLSSAILAAAIEHVRLVCEVVFSQTLNDIDEEDGAELADGNPPATGKLKSKFNTFDMTQSREETGQLLELERLIDELDIPGDGLTKDGSYIVDLFGRAGLNTWTKDSALSCMDEILSFSNASQNSRIRKTKGLSEICDFIKTVFGVHSLTSGDPYALPFKNPGKLPDELFDCYRVFIKDEPIVNRYGSTGNNVWDTHVDLKKSVTNRTISYWCFSPGRAVQELIKQKVRCLILTSGTLFPIEPLEAELKLKFPITLQNPHVINPEQLNLTVITRGPDNEKLNGSYSVRGTAAYRSSLGLLLVSLAQTVPSGLLVFFPSYAFMSQCLEFWKNGPIFDRIMQRKQVFLEPRDKQQFSKVFSDYRSAACTHLNGAVLFAVMRGRVSEGLDLADDSGRGVVVLGLPYPPFYDPRVKLKMAYLDEQVVKSGGSNSKSSTQNTYPTGRQWYNMQAWRAINQAVGRVIRHSRDYGAIFLCDERFASNSAQSNLSVWMRSSRQVYSEPGPALKQVVQFFKTMRTKYPTTISSTNSTTTPQHSYMGHLDQKTNPLMTTNHSLSLPYNLTRYRSANEVTVFAHSISNNEVTESTLLTNYSSLGNYITSKALTMENSGPSTSSVFELVYEPKEQHIPLTENTTNIKPDMDNSLESRLLTNRPLKRIRLSRPDDQLNQVKVQKSEGSAYLATIKATFNSPAAKLLGKPFMEDFKEAIRDYKNEQESDTDHNRNPVDVLFSKLARIFMTLETPGLLQDAVCMVRQNHRPYYAQLCQNLTGLPTIQPVESTSSAKNNLETRSNDQTTHAVPTVNTQAMKCVKCSSRPPKVPLISVCRHIACFECWKKIIEKGNRRCPSCQKLTRKRDLARLTNTGGSEN